MPQDGDSGAACEKVGAVMGGFFKLGGMPKMGGAKTCNLYEYFGQGPWRVEGMSRREWPRHYYVYAILENYQ